MSKEIAALHAKELSSTSTLTYQIRDVPSDDYMSMYQLEPLDTPIEGCSECSHSKYTDVNDAYKHIIRKHLGKNHGEEAEARKTRLGHWIVSVDCSLVERKNAEAIKLMETLNQRTENYYPRL
jgi:hypothetical protein